MAYSSKEWHRILSSWEKSGLTRTEYCREQNLTLSTFDYWKRKLKTRHEQKGELIRIEAKNIVLPDSPLILELPGGYRLTVSSRYDGDHLKRLISDIREIL